MHARRYPAAALALHAAPAERVVAIRTGRLIEGIGAAPRENVTILVRGAPLRDEEILKQVGFVMKDGVVYKRNGTPLADPRPANSAH